MLLWTPGFAQQIDTAAGYADDSSLMQLQADTFMNTTYARIKDAQSILLTGNKVMVNDIEQYHSTGNNGFIFVLLILMIVVITYLKTAFSNDLSDLVQSVINRNMAQQVFRSRTKDVSFSSIVLNINFIIAISLFIHFIMMKYMHAATTDNAGTILLIIFLFTFFYLAKIAALKFIGVMFDAREECDEYIFNFTGMCKTAGLALLPALFICYTTQQKFYSAVFVIIILISCYLLVNFVWRGLSTGYKLMYRSVYHFFIYVCVVEISPIFLLFKLLTKTII
jgi:Domain of unknown function (DUF4271)